MSVVESHFDGNCSQIHSSQDEKNGEGTEGHYTNTKKWNTLKNRFNLQDEQVLRTTRWTNRSIRSPSDPG
jgi:hypothetical protein